MDRLEYYRKMYGKRNSFFCLLDMHVESVDTGHAKISMPIAADKHVNMVNMLHGGAIMSLADTAMGLSCLSAGKRVVSLAITTNFISGAGLGEKMIATAEVVHTGNKTMVVDCNLKNVYNKLIAKVQGTFYIIDDYREVEDFE